MPGPTNLDFSKPTVTIIQRTPRDFRAYIEVSGSRFGGEGTSVVAAIEAAAKTVRSETKNLPGRPTKRHQVARWLRKP